MIEFDGGEWVVWLAVIFAAVASIVMLWNKTGDDEPDEHDR